MKVNYKLIRRYVIEDRNIRNNLHNLKRVWNDFNASNHVLRNKCSFH